MDKLMVLGRLIRCMTVLLGYLLVKSFFFNNECPTYETVHDTKDNDVEVTVRITIAYISGMPPGRL